MGRDSDERCDRSEEVEDGAGAGSRAAADNLPHLLPDRRIPP